MKTEQYTQTMEFPIKWGTGSGKAWADMVEEEENPECSDNSSSKLFYTCSSNSADGVFDPLLDQSSKDGINLCFANSLKSLIENKEYDSDKENENKTKRKEPDTIRNDEENVLSKKKKTETGSTKVAHEVDSSTVVQKNPVLQSIATKNVPKHPASLKSRNNFKKKKQKPVETDVLKLSQREKQITFGKNTQGYLNFTKLRSKQERLPTDPQTPDKFQICSKRSWDGQVKKWRRELHKFDTESENDTESESENIEQTDDINNEVENNEKNEIEVKNHEENDPENI